MTAHVLSIRCTANEAAEAIARDDPFAGVSPEPTLVATEEKDGWTLALYLEEKPAPAIVAAFRALAPSATAAPRCASLGDEDWVTLSQAGLRPVDLGRFHIHAGPPERALLPGRWPLRIDAGLAFGTGQHQTTSGAIRAAILVAKRHGGHRGKQHEKKNILDVGTGTGLLSFAARRLFPTARLTASDIDPIAVRVARENARVNHVRRGRGRGAIALLAAPGVGHPLIARRAPYDLVFANILAGPLVRLAPSLAGIVAPGGQLILAGLLQPQLARVRAAYGARGLVVERFGHFDRRAEWPVLLLRRKA